MVFWLRNYSVFTQADNLAVLLRINSIVTLVLNVFSEKLKNLALLLSL